MHAGVVSILNGEVLATVRSSRQAMNMEWPSEVAAGDAVIVRLDRPSSPQFVVHGSRGAQLACASYTEAEAHAASYAEHARGNVWYVERGRLQLVCSFSSGPSQTPSLDWTR